MVETFKPITNFERYSISNLGNIQSSYKGCQILKPILINGSYKVNLQTKDTGRATPKPITRLVAEHFLENPDNLTIIKHKNGDKSDNRADNLEYIRSIKATGDALKQQCKEATRKFVKINLEIFKKYYESKQCYEDFKIFCITNNFEEFTVRRFQLDLKEFAIPKKVTLRPRIRGGAYKLRDDYIDDTNNQ